MGWRIHSWDTKTLRGSVVAGDWEPIPFGPTENDLGIEDFTPGEEVEVRLGDHSPPEMVTRVRPVQARQPAGTELAEFAELNALAHHDIHVRSQTSSKIVFWLGYCCEGCSSSALFTCKAPDLEIRTVRAPFNVDDFELEEPWFRAMSSDELELLSPTARQKRWKICLAPRDDDERQDRILIACDEFHVEHTPPFGEA